MKVVLPERFILLVPSNVEGSLSKGRVLIYGGREAY